MDRNSGLKGRGTSKVPVKRVLVVQTVVVVSAPTWTYDGWYPVSVTGSFVSTDQTLFLPEIFSTAKG